MNRAVVSPAPDASAAPAGARGVGRINVGLKWVGVVAGPLFATTIAVQALTRDGFRLADHPFSLLALGGQGWIQTTNFIVCGLAFAVGAVAASRSTIRAVPTLVARLIAVYGIASILAGVFPTDPWRGFPAGLSDVTTGHGLAHNIAAGVGGLALIAAAAVAARAHRRSGSRSRFRLDLVVAVAGLVLGAIGSGLGDFRIAYAAGLITWLWASFTLADAR